MPVLLFLTAKVDLFQFPFWRLPIKIHSLCHPFTCCCFPKALDCKNIIIPDQILLSHLQNCYKTSEHSPVRSLSMSYLASSYISVLAWSSKIEAYVTVIRLKISDTSYQILRWMNKITSMNTHTHKHFNNLVIFLRIYCSLKNKLLSGKKNNVMSYLSE